MTCCRKNNIIFLKILVAIFSHSPFILIFSLINITAFFVRFIYVVNTKISPINFVTPQKQKKKKPKIITLWCIIFKNFLQTTPNAPFQFNAGAASPAASNIFA